ncbi:Epoxyqueuosine reductase [Tepidimonas thermarum]|uniref:Epoxyqueuosine reductase n=1 Tax=Tepidimonas thermarum TaxID=335431 RepID=A0A554X9A7_9BURK|nr:Epoxyqueuosine reductase [Tepidimonas thermarum]
MAPYRLDARRCISYVTIEHDGPIPEPLRRPMGNRIYGCDDCQLVCPWNKYARRSPLPDFDARAPLAAPRLLELWAWTEADFERLTEGSAIRRIGYARWRRNLAVALGNARAAARARGDTASAAAITAALASACNDPDPTGWVREHIVWALEG